MKTVVALAALFHIVVIVATVPTPHANPGGSIPDLAGSHPVGKSHGHGVQFIAGECLSDADCSSGYSTGARQAAAASPPPPPPKGAPKRIRARPRMESAESARGFSYLAGRGRPSNGWGTPD